jgi:hypothetical protein
MKNTILIILTTCTFVTAEAQITRAYAFGSGGVATGEGLAYQFGTSVVLENKWIITAGYLNAKRNADHPADFSTYSGTGYPGFEYETYPPATTKLLYASAGRYIRYSKRIRFIMDAGLGVSSGDLLSFEKGRSREHKENRYSPNYSVKYSNQTSIGSIIRAGADVLFARSAGIGFDLYYNYNGGGLQNNFGLNVRLMLGHLLAED